jgi:hypothetical protein
LMRPIDQPPFQSTISRNDRSPAKSNNDDARSPAARQSVRRPRRDVLGIARVRASARGAGPVAPRAPRALAPRRVLLRARARGPRGARGGDDRLRAHVPARGPPRRRGRRPRARRGPRGARRGGSRRPRGRAPGDARRRARQARVGRHADGATTVRRPAPSPPRVARLVSSSEKKRSCASASPSPSARSLPLTPPTSPRYSPRFYDL